MKIKLIAGKITFHEDINLVMDVPVISEFVLLREKVIQCNMELKSW